MSPRTDQPHDLNAAWQAVHDELPEGWFLHDLRFVPAGSRLGRRRGDHWRAVASRRTDLGLPTAGMCGIGDEALSALWRLADLLSGIHAPRRWPSRAEFARMTPSEVNRYFASVGLSARVRDNGALPLSGQDPDGAPSGPNSVSP